MYGAIMGDIVGSPFEFDRGEKTKDFDLFSPGARFTDDTVMTVAVAEALLEAGPEATIDTLHEYLVRSLKHWGRRYPGAGYGGRFGRWLLSEDTHPYGSYGNGSAMRASAAGWLYDDPERTLEVAKATAEVTHDHPEGIKGAQAVAGIIFLARHGADKAAIREFAEKQLGYRLDRTIDEIRPHYRHVESCRETVPEAITAFLEGEDFEDVVRTAVSLGGDCDTLTDIAAAMAEAFYGMPALLCAEVRARIPEEMVAVLDRFDAALGRRHDDDAELAGNALLVQTYLNMKTMDTDESRILFVESFRQRSLAGGRLLLDMWAQFDIAGMLDIEHLKVGDTFTANEEQRFVPATVRTPDGSEWMVAYTATEESTKGDSGNATFSMPIPQVLEAVMANTGVEGIVLDPWSTGMVLPKPAVELLISACNEKEE